MSAFLLYLWGIETLQYCFFKAEALQFLLYLWGIETSLSLDAVRYKQSIFTLPMRHWNFNFLFNFNAHILYFYSTYEALKLNKAHLKAAIKLIFTLPMRHWNIPSSVLLFPVSTDFYSTYEALKLSDKRFDYNAKQNFYSTYEALKLCEI